MTSTDVAWAYRSLAAGLLALMLALPAPALAADCRTLLRGFVERLNKVDPEAAKGLIGEIDVHCPPKSRIAARNRLGALIARLAQRERDLGKAPDAVLEDVRPYLAYADHWTLQRTLGDLSMEAGDFTEAAQRYLRALDLMDSERFTPRAPNAVEINNVHTAASTAMTLSAAPVSPKTRSGATTAYFKRSVRGVQTPKITPQVTYEYDSDAFTPTGADVARGLAPILAQESPTRLTIIGHTDDQGGDAYNMALSRKRVERLQRFLRDESGYSGEIRMRWCGERVPVNVESVGRFKQDQIHQINRRVEVFYGQGGEDKASYYVCEG